MKPVNFDNIPDELKNRPQWVLWRLETRKDKIAKVPYAANGCKAAVDKPDTWTDYATACAAYQGKPLQGPPLKFSGIGFVLTKEDPIVGVDLDKCLNPETGELDALAADIIAALPTYCEKSPSERGFRLFALGSLPPGGRRKGIVEMYDSGRYLTVTGDRYGDHAALVDCTAPLAQIHARLFAKPAPRAARAASPSPSSPPEGSRLSDQQLLDKINASNQGPAFSQLWEGIHGGDDSGADLALCNMLAFWTGKDPGQMDRLFRLSGLMRPKWDEKRSDAGTYGQRTIATAIEGTQETYQQNNPSSRARNGKSEKTLHNPTSTDKTITYKVSTLHQPYTNPTPPYTIEVCNLESQDGKDEIVLIESVAAERIANCLKDRWAFSRESLLWHYFTGTHWQAVTSQVVDELVQKILYAGTTKGFKARHIAAMTTLLSKGLLPLPEVDSAQDLIPFTNGLLNLKTRALCAAKSDNALTWSLPYAYDPAADCPTIKRWLKQAVAENEEMVEFLRAWLSALLTGRADLQKFLHLLGYPGTGKGAFMRLAVALVGSQNATVTDLKNLETNRFETAALYGKRLVMITDTNKYGGSVDVLKAMTGQDLIRLERKHQQQGLTFTFIGMVVLASNEALMTNDHTSALERRRLTVRFDRVASEEDRQLWDKDGGETAVLHREIPGLVNWLLDLTRDQVTRLIMKPPRCLLENNQEAMRYSNAIADWLMDAVIPDPKANTGIGLKRQSQRNGTIIFEDADQNFYPNYLTWCQQTARDAVSLVRFSALVMDMAQNFKVPVVKGRDKKGMYLNGLRLRLESESAYPWGDKEIF